VTALVKLHFQRFIEKQKTPTMCCIDGKGQEKHAAGGSSDLAIACAEA